MRVDVETFESGKKKLRIQIYPDKCGRGLSYIVKLRDEGCASLTKRVGDKKNFTTQEVRKSAAHCFILLHNACRRTWRTARLFHAKTRRTRATLGSSLLSLLLPQERILNWPRLKGRQLFDRNFKAFNAPKALLAKNTRPNRQVFFNSE